MKQLIRTASWLAVSVALLQACSGGSGAAPAPKLIAQIQVSGAPVKVFDHTRDQQQPGNIPDAQTSAWREADGTVNLMIGSTEAYRMRGLDLEHLSIDPHEIYSSDASAKQIPEDPHNYNHWLMGPYSTDGVHYYSLSHSEWYACLLDGDCAQSAADGGDAQGNSWANTVNSFVSGDGGASWQLNLVNGNHVVADTSFHWTGSPELARKIYLQADNHTGIFQPTRLVREGSYWYAVGYYIRRDFSQVDPAQGVYQAPVDQSGYVLMRSADFTDPNGWQAWSGGASYTPIADQAFITFQPQRNGVALSAAPPQLVYDSVAQVYVLIHTLFGGSNAVYYMTTPSLAAPAWSDSTPILGTAELITDPAGPVRGFNDGNYTSILDDSSAGYSFEFIGDSPQLFYSTFPIRYGGDNLARDVYRLPLKVTYL